MSSRPVVKGQWVHGLEQRAPGNVICGDALFAAQLRSDIHGRPEWLDLQIDVAGRGVVQVQLDFDSALSLVSLVEQLQLEAEKQALGGSLREG